MRIDIVTPAFNVAPYIGTAILSVLGQTHQNWGMTIIDDGSTDETASIAGHYNDPRIRIIPQVNLGVSAARNRGIAEVSGDAVLFLDADDWLSPEALSILAEALFRDPGAIAAVGSYRYVHESDHLDSIGESRSFPPASGDLLKVLLVRNLFANGGHLLIRRQALEAAGEFSIALLYGEDWEYWIRLAQQGSFAAANASAPLLFVRQRRGSAYFNMAAEPESFTPCMDVIFNAPELQARFGAQELLRLRRRTNAENDWIVGRELVRHGKWSEGQPFLRRSVRAAPGLRRLVLLAMASLPMLQIGPFRRYSMTESATEMS